MPQTHFNILIFDTFILLVSRQPDKKHYKATVSNNCTVEHML